QARITLRSRAQENQLVELAHAPGFEHVVVGGRAGVAALAAGEYAVGAHLRPQGHHHAPRGAIALGRGIDDARAAAAVQVHMAEAGQLEQVQ
nr:hypothetical protein [Tanacetum cinerariifolium]